MKKILKFVKYIILIDLVCAMLTLLLACTSGIRATQYEKKAQHYKEKIEQMDFDEIESRPA